MTTYRELDEFLAARLEGGSEWVGVSSNAMVREALKRGDVIRSEFPRDHADLSRCCMTYARAPWSLKALMLPRLATYFDHAMNGFRHPEPVVPKLSVFDRWKRYWWRIGFRAGAGEWPPAWLKSPYDRDKS